MSIHEVAPTTEAVPSCRRGPIVFALLATVYVALRLWHLDAYSLDGDEIFSLRAARQDWNGLLSVAAHDVSHPPLFYLLLKVWIGLGGESLFWLRLYPALTGIACILPFFLLCRELKLRWAETNLALALLAVNGYLIYYTQHLRMFILMEFFSLGSLWLFVRFLQTETQPRRALLLLFLVNVLLVYSHYWGWVFVGTEFLLVLVWDRRKLLHYSLSLLGLVLCFSPWAYAVAQAALAKGSAVEQVNWISVPTWRDLVYFYASLNGPFPLARTTLLGYVLFLAPVLLWSWRLVRTKQEDGLFCLLAIFAFVPVLVTFVASVVLPQSVWAERQLLIVAAPYLILVAAAVWRLRPSGAKAFVAALAVTWASVAGFTALTGGNEKIAWDRLVAVMLRAEPLHAEQVSVYGLEGFVTEPIAFNLELAGETRFRVEMVKDFGTPDKDHFWVAYRDIKWKEDRSPQQLMADRGYEPGQTYPAKIRSQTVFVFPARKRASQ